MVSRFLAGWEITLTLTQSEWERNRRSATVTLTRNRRSSTIDARSLALVRNLLAILMCLQVLVCPALCIDVCQLHEQANGPSSHLEGSLQCHCCGSDASPENESNAPCDPSSECCNCFCGGAVVSETDSVYLPIHFAVSDVATIAQCAFTTEHTDCVQPAEHVADGALIFGSAILCAYCVLQI